MLDNETADTEEPIDLNEFPQSPPQQSGEQLFNQLMSNMCNTSTSSVLVSQEQQERMAENKRRAEEKRKSRLLNTSLQLNASTSEGNTFVSNSHLEQSPAKNGGVQLVDIDDVASSEVRIDSSPAKQAKDNDDDLVCIDDILSDLS